MYETHKDKVSFSRKLRKNMTPWERKLWYMFLRNYPVKFQRQKIVGNYIVDFYCAKAHLAIEVDGSIHFVPQKMISDDYRARHIEKKDLFVLRIMNDEVDKNFYEVCERIDRIVQSRIES